MTWTFFDIFTKSVLWLWCVLLAERLFASGIARFLHLRAHG